MKPSTFEMDGFLIARILGAMSKDASGQLCNALVKIVANGATKVIADLSGVVRVTRAGVRALIIAAKLLQARRGALRSCAARPLVEAGLRGFGIRHLLRCDPTFEASMSEPIRRPARRSAAPAAYAWDRTPSAARQPLARLHAGAANIFD